jgi:hypothetical protein
MKKLTKINLICTFIALALMGAYSFSFTQGSDVIFFVNPDDCTTFYMEEGDYEQFGCHQVRPPCPPGCTISHVRFIATATFLLKCPPDLHWNHSHLVCDWPENCWKCGNQH